MSYGLNLAFGVPTLDSTYNLAVNTVDTVGDITAGEDVETRSVNFQDLSADPEPTLNTLWYHTTENRLYLNTTPVAANLVVTATTSTTYGPTDNWAIDVLISDISANDVYITFPPPVDMAAFVDGDSVVFFATAAGSNYHVFIDTNGNLIDGDAQDRMISSGGFVHIFKIDGALRVVSSSLYTRKMSPPDVGHLEYWMDGDNGVVVTGSLVDSWTDQQNSRVCSATLTDRPTLVTAGLNGHDTLEFNGSNQLSFGDVENFYSNTRGFTFIAVVKSDQQSGVILGKWNQTGSVKCTQIGMRYGFLSQTGSDYAYTYMNAPGGDWLIYAITWAPSEKIRGWIDGEMIYESGAILSSIYASSAEPLLIGNTTDAWIEVQYDGQIAEMLMYSDKISQSDMIDLTNTLSVKYGITEASYPTYGLWRRDESTHTLTTLDDDDITEMAGNRFIARTAAPMTNTIWQNSADSELYFNGVQLSNPTITATAATTTTTNFDHVLSAADTTVQAALETIDEIFEDVITVNFTEHASDPALTLANDSTNTNAKNLTFYENESGNGWVMGTLNRNVARPDYMAAIVTAGGLNGPALRLLYPGSDYTTGEVIALVGDGSTTLSIYNAYMTGTGNSGAIVSCIKDSTQTGGFQIIPSADMSAASFRQNLVGFNIAKSGSNSARTCEDGAVASITVDEDGIMSFYTIDSTSSASYNAYLTANQHMDITGDGEIYMHHLDDRSSSNDTKLVMLDNTTKELHTVSDLDTSASAANMRISSLSSGEIFVSTSSIRRKTITNQEFDVSGLYELSPSLFDFKSEKTGREELNIYGLIAEDVYQNLGIPFVEFKTYSDEDIVANNWQDFIIESFVEEIEGEDDKISHSVVEAIDWQAINTATVASLIELKGEMQTLQANMETLQEDFRQLKEALL